MRNSASTKPPPEIIGTSPMMTVDCSRIQPYDVMLGLVPTMTVLE